MHFKEGFEKSLNDNMYETDDGQPGRAPPAEADMDIKKKGYPSPQPDIQDHELSEKKDNPPRFSTLFGSTPAPAPQAPEREYVRGYYSEPKRKSGVFIPMPLFIIFAIILFFESTILFAYTVIGLYNNAPSRLFPWAGAGVATTTAVCDHNQPPSIVNAPNFIVPGQGQAQGTEIMTQFVTISPTQASTSTTSSTSSTSSINTAAAITDIAGILGSLGSSTSSGKVAIVTVAPEQSTATSIKLITEDASGNVVSAEPTPTVTATTFVDPPKSSTQT